MRAAQSSSRPPRAAAYAASSARSSAPAASGRTRPRVAIPPAIRASYRFCKSCAETVALFAGLHVGTGDDPLAHRQTPAVEGGALERGARDRCADAEEQRVDLRG